MTRVVGDESHLTFTNGVLTLKLLSFDVNNNRNYGLKQKIQLDMCNVSNKTIEKLLN